MGQAGAIEIDLQPTEDEFLPLVVYSTGDQELPRCCISAFVTSPDGYVQPRLLDTLEPLFPGVKYRFYLPFGDGFKIRFSMEGASVSVIDRYNVVEFPRKT